jgi:hypothetical protein
MLLQKVLISKKIFFVDVLKVTDENSRILIYWSEVWIRGSGSVPKFHGSATQHWFILTVLLYRC